ncbi:MAG: DNRLRE domain-containing protein [Chloroflexota bacterium]|nr:MAG: DNRLRE domain-containing protein [Chloroflexota bacterium]
MRNSLNRFRLALLSLLATLGVVCAISLYSGILPDISTQSVSAAGGKTIYLPLLFGSGSTVPSATATPTGIATATSTLTPTRTKTPTPTTSPSTPPPTEIPSNGARRVNAPHYDGGPLYFGGIFWFGKVTSSENYSDVRVGYTDSELYVSANIIDRRLWYNTNPSSSALTAWDAVTLYLNTDGNTGNKPSTHAYKFVAQMNAWESPRSNWQAAYQGNGTGWNASSTSFTSEATWRGAGLNDNTNDHGWVATFHIPFSSLGLSGPPDGAIWGLGMTLHDRDDANGTAIPVKIWPETLVTDSPETWGQVYFGDPPAYTSPPSSSQSTTTIRNGLNGVTVKDGEVGGHTTCGNGLDVWSEWGEKNYMGEKQINIQNQDDVADWPCFSKYYITFPLNSVPANKVIVSASLTMHQFGNAGQGWNPPPYPSWIQVFTLKDNWNESTLNWNNAPLAEQDFGGAQADPLSTVPPWPGISVNWDVSSAAAKAYAQGQPLRLVLYSSDRPMHSGKYFYSSDADPEGRPTLQVIWGDP